jgi:hypothetical protein
MKNVRTKCRYKKIKCMYFNSQHSPIMTLPASHNKRHNFGLFLLGIFVCNRLFNAWVTITTVKFIQHQMRWENVYEQ